METFFEAVTLLGSLPLALWFGRMCLNGVFELMPARDRASGYFASRAWHLLDAIHRGRLLRVWSSGLHR